MHSTIKRNSHGKRRVVHGFLRLYKMTFQILCFPISQIPLRTGLPHYQSAGVNIINRALSAIRTNPILREVINSHKHARIIRATTNYIYNLISSIKCLLFCFALFLLFQYMSRICKEELPLVHVSIWYIYWKLLFFILWFIFCIYNIYTFILNVCVFQEYSHFRHDAKECKYWHALRSPVCRGCLARLW